MKRPNPKDYNVKDFLRGRYENDLERYIDFLEACREYDAGYGNRPEGYVLTPHYTGKRQSE